MNAEKQFKRLVILIPVVSACIFVLLATLCIIQAKNFMEKNIEENVTSGFNYQFLLVEEHLSKLIEVSSLISSRTTLKQHLEDYLNGLITESQFNKISIQLLKDSLESFPELVSIVRIPIDDSTIVFCGEQVPEYLFTPPQHPHDFYICPLLDQSGDNFVAIYSPVLDSKKERIATDIFLFSTKNIHKLILLPFKDVNIEFEVSILLWDRKNFPLELFYSTTSKKKDQRLADIRQLINSGQLGIYGKIKDKKKLIMYKRLSEKSSPPMYIVSTLYIPGIMASVKESLLFMTASAGLLAAMAFFLVFGFIKPCSDTMQDQINYIEKLNEKLNIEIERHKEYEARLQDSELRFRIFMDNIPGIIFLKDEEGRFTYINDYCIRKGLINTDEWIGKYEKDVWPIDGSYNRNADVEESIGESPYSSKIEILNINGKKMPFITYRFPVITEHYKKSYGGVAFDIGDVIKLEAELIKQRESLALTLMSISDAVIVTDADYKINMINRAACEILEYQPHECIGQKITSILHIYNNLGGRITSEQEFLEAIGAYNTRKTLIVETQSGKRKSVEDSFSQIKNKSNAIIGYIFVFKDVTLFEKMQEHLARVQRMETIGMLAGGIAHDFNNILSVIIGNVGLAKMMFKDNKELMAIIAEIERVSERAKDLTKKFLLFSKGGRPKIEECNIFALLNECINVNLSGSNISLDLKIPNNLWNGLVDRSLIMQAFSNIILNAKQAVPIENPKIIVEAENIELASNNSVGLCAGKYIKISITDNGPGIDPGVIDKVFDPYYTTKPGSKGLGLFIAHSIITKHNGMIEVENTSEAGAKCTIILPAVLPTVTKEEKKIITRETSEKERSPQRKILVMDDEESILKFAKLSLEKLGHVVQVARDGNSAIQLFKKAIEENSPFDLVILDLIIMGGKGGLETLEELKKINPNVVAIVSSGYSDEAVMASYEKHGFKFALPKPYTIDELKDLVKRV